MSISLNDHENRIKALENKTTGTSITLVKSENLPNGFYREYSDGFRMQSGYLNESGTWGHTTVKLPKPMSNTNYVIILTPDGDETWDYNWLLESKTTTSWGGTFRFGRKFWWAVYGYFNIHSIEITSSFIKEVLL